MQPLAARLRPHTLDTFFGQRHLLDTGKPLHMALKHKKLHSMILWGPPGTGKTTLAQMLASAADMHFEALSAVMAGVKDIRQVVETAAKQQKGTVLFIDEIHRFNKGQQDALLPFVESGTLTLIGATTENPSFELNQALLSRARVYVLKSLDEADLEAILSRALYDSDGLASLHLKVEPQAQKALIDLAQGDGRRLLNVLDVIAQWIEAHESEPVITQEVVQQVLDARLAHFDKGGEHFYDQISALHKSVRGSDPDATLYWFARMLNGGCDMSYLARRIVRMASEDVGNADPKALNLALDASLAMERLGQPEGELALAQALVYMALAPKSNAVYVALGEAKRFAAQTGDKPVPLHLRNAPTKLMKSLDYGKAYQYDHDFPEGVAWSQNYFPDKVKHKTFYKPTARGLEGKIQDKLKWLKEHREKQV